MPDEATEFDNINPHSPSRPMVCPVCRAKDGAYFGRLSFYPFAAQHCPMHKLAIKEGTLTMDQIALVPA